MSDTIRKRILVAVDGSEQALEAVRYVSGTLPADQIHVVLFHVMTKVPESFWDLQKEPTYHYRIADIGAWELQQEKMIREFMTGARQILIEKGIPDDEVTVKIQERMAGIAQDIIAESQDNYSVVVVGRRGLSELKDIVLGSIANKLVEKSVEVPIWVVGGKQQRGKILLSMDASEGAMQAVNHVAAMLEGSTNFEVTLFHVVRRLDIFPQVLEKSVGPDQLKDWMEDAEKELEEARKGIEPVFEKAVSRLLKAGMDPSRVNRKIAKGRGSRAGAIADEAEQGGYDTIVVGRRGLSRVQEFFMGRVSNKVIQLAREKTVWVVN